MLKVPLVFLLLCGLFTSPGAQQYLDEVTQRLIRAGLVATASSGDFQRWLGRAFSRSFGPQDVLGGLLLGVSGNLGVQVKDAQLLQVSLEVNAASREAYLRIPLLFGVVIRSVTFRVRADLAVQLALEQDLQDRYRLTFGSCRLPPQFVQIQIQSGNLVPPLPLPEFAIKGIERGLRVAMTHNLGEVMCPVIDRALSSLNPEEVNEIIYKIIQPSNDQDIN